MMKYILCVLMPALIFSLAGCSSGGGTETVNNENLTPERRLYNELCKRKIHKR